MLCNVCESALLLKLIDLHTFANTDLVCHVAQVNQNSIVIWPKIIIFREYEGDMKHG